MDRVQDTISDAEHQCQSHGTQLTTKRKQILAGLLRSERALSAYELVDYFKDTHGESMPPMSVYRILEFLEKEQLVHKLSLSNRYVACSHISCDHAHELPQFLICTECQRVEEVHIGKITLDALNKSAKAAGFNLTTPQLELNCICDDCKSRPA